MLNIEIKKNYKSIKSPISFDFEDFIILTGKNGSGKTQLLEVIANCEYSITKRKDKNLNKIAYVPFNRLNPKIKETVNETEIRNFINSIWGKLSKNLMTYPDNIYHNKIKQQPFSSTDKLNEKQIEFIYKTMHNTGKKINEISHDDLHSNFDISYMENDFFSAEFALIFLNYFKLWNQNQYISYLNSKGLSKKIPLSDNEFKDKYGTPPWDFVNDILHSLNLPFKVNKPESFEHDVDFNFCLSDEEGNEIHFKDLSTGEKVLMSLALVVYNSNGRVGMPDLILLDEPDAPLHPSMSKKLIEVLKNEIVEKMNVPVVITTHSPITLVAAQDLPIYEMKRGESTPKKVNSDIAIKDLSGGIPYLKISDDARRPVFVENKNDVSYYEKIRNAILKIKTLQSEAVFLPVRTSDGCNCEDVKNIVNNLVRTGNNQVYGIIDWDLHNIAHDNILVLGNGARYAIENFILDPLIMALYFLWEKNKNIADFGIKSISSIIDAKNLSKDDAQILIDKILLELNLEKGERISYELMNGWKLQITKEFAEIKGHDLEDLYKNKISFLKKHKNESSLKNDVANKIISDFPSFIPNDLYLTINSIK